MEAKTTHSALVADTIGEIAGNTHRWGLARSIELAQFTLRTGATLRGHGRFIPRTEINSVESGHWALFGRP